MELIQSETVGRVLTYKLLVDAVARGLGLFSQGQSVQSGSVASVVQPVRSVVNVANKGTLSCMPVYVGAEQLLLTKLVTFFPGNKDSPSHNAVIVVFNATTGIPRAFLDGDTITTRRTAAASVVATKFLANGDPKVLAILGCGTQGLSHCEAFCDTFQLEQVRVWNHRSERARQFAQHQTRQGHNCVACDTAESAVTGADVIVTTTSNSLAPIVLASWVKTGAHINAVGACRLEWVELDPALVRSAIVYVDSRQGAQEESGDIHLAKAEVYAELGEVVNGTKTAYRDKTTVFKSLGLAVEDAVAAKIVLDELQL